MNNENPNLSPEENKNDPQPEAAPAPEAPQSQPQIPFTPATPQYQYAPAAAAQKNTDVFGIVALVLGILSVTICCCFDYIGLVISAGAIVCAILSRKNNGGKMSGMAVAGLVLGIIGFVYAVIGAVYALLITFSSAFREAVESVCADYGIEVRF